MRAAKQGRAGIKGQLRAPAGGFIYAANARK